MKTFRKPSRLNRALAATLALLVGLGPVATPTYAALTALADEPLNVKNSSKPNIVLTIDDSTSMLFDFLPDTVIDRYCRDGTGSMNSICGAPGYQGDFSAFGFGKDVTPGYIFQQYNYPFTTFATQDTTHADVVVLRRRRPGLRLRHFDSALLAGRRRRHESRHPGVPDAPPCIPTRPTRR